MNTHLPQPGPFEPPGSLPGSSPGSPRNGEHAARLALCVVADRLSRNPDVSLDADLADLVDRFGPQAALEQLRADGRLAGRALPADLTCVDVARLQEQAALAHATMVLPSDPQWPSSLQTMAHPPYALWVSGRPLEQVAGSVALTGSRACSEYGNAVAAQIAAGLVGAAVGVGVGASWGVEQAALGATLAADGVALVVLHGSEQHGAVDRVTGRGTLVGESPPGAGPSPRRRERRLRLQVALSRAFVVVEGSSRSRVVAGLEQAARSGVPVLAVPGPVTSVTSALPNRLIASGRAQLVTGAADVLAFASPLRR